MSLALPKSYSGLPPVVCSLCEFFAHQGVTPALRYITIGDIHGCYDELAELIDRISPAEDDVVISVGDIVRKGPAPEKCLDLWRDRGWLAVLGNQEEKVLSSVSDIRSELISWIRTWPLFLDFPEAALLVVHGGLLPDTEISAEAIGAQVATITTLRYLRDENGKWSAVPKGQEREGDRFWTELWKGPRTIVYGHTPRPEVRRDAKAIGLDTACVYGGRLSAAILEDATWTFASVTARRQYAQPRRPTI